MQQELSLKRITAGHSAEQAATAARVEKARRELAAERKRVAVEMEELQRCVAKLGDACATAETRLEEELGQGLRAAQDSAEAEQRLEEAAEAQRAQLLAGLSLLLLLLLL